MPLMQGEQIPRILKLADRIAEDIRRRNLKPGDPYQGTTETAEMLGVSTTAANRAMQVLVKRRLIERRQRKGTFVAHPSDKPSSSPLRRVHLLVQENYLRTEGLLSDGVIVGMHDELASAQVQFNFLPMGDQGEYVKQLIGEAMRSDQTEGFVLVRASLQVQRIMSDSGLPVVVHGSLHPSVPAMSWIDRDHRTGGALMTEHLLARGFRRIVVLMRDAMFRGDHVLFDSIRDTVAAHRGGNDLGALTLRSLSPDLLAVKASVDELLQSAPRGQRIGFICRSEPLAIGVEAAARERNLTVGRDVGIVVSDVYRKGSDVPPRWPYLKATLTPEEIGKHIGHMLAQQAPHSGSAEPAREIIPVCLQIPE